MTRIFLDRSRNAWSDSYRFNATFRQALSEYDALLQQIRGAGLPPPSDYWHQPLDDAIGRLYDAARYGAEMLPPGAVSERAAVPPTGGR